MLGGGGEEWNAVWIGGLESGVYWGKKVWYMHGRLKVA